MNELIVMMAKILPEDKVIEMVEEALKQPGEGIINQEILFRKGPREIAE